MAVTVSIQGITEFTEDLERVQRSLPDKAINTIDRHSRRVVREYRKRIKPIRKTGNLSRGMRSMKAQPEGNDWVGGNKSYAPHFHLLEYGHKVVPIKGRSKGWSSGTAKKDGYARPGNTAYVKGRYDLKKTLGMTERLFHKDVDKMIQEGLEVLGD